MSVDRKIGDALNDKGTYAGEIWSTLHGVSMRDIGGEPVETIEPATARGLANLLKRAATEVEEMRERAAKVAAAVGGSR